MIKMMFKNEKGYALVLVLIIMLIFFMLGTVLITVSTTQVREAVRQQERVQAYYLAYSGANAVAEWVMTGNDVPEGESGVVELDTGSFFVDVVENGNHLIITSRGTVNGYTETVVVTLTRQDGGTGGGFPPVDNAVFATSDGNDINPAISILGSRSIIGPMGTNATAENSVSLGAGTSKIVDGHLYLGYNAIPDDVIINSTQSIPGNRTIDDILSEGYEVRTYPELISYPPINFPEFPEGLPQRNNFTTPWTPGLYYEISQDGQYDLIEVTSSRTLTIDLQGGTRILRVNTFRVQGTVELINVGENGKLMLYIDQRFETSGNRDINVTGDGAGNNNAFNVFLQGNVSFPHTVQPYKFAGNVVTDNGNVNVGANCRFIGNIFTMNGNVTVSGAGVAGTPHEVDGLIYAPNSHVQILGSGKVSGAVVSNTFYTNGGGPAVTFNFQAQDLDFLPFNIFDNSGGDNGGNAESASWVNPLWGGD